MKRTINERKAGFRMIWSALFIYICLMLMLISARKGLPIIGMISFFAFIFFMFMFWFSGYSLGWEYKRISSQNRSNANNKKEVENERRK